MYKSVLVIALLFLITSCTENIVRIDEYNYNLLDEVKAQEIKLPELLADKHNEYSGLCRFGNSLLLLPQFPQKYINDTFAFPLISDTELNKAITDTTYVIKPTYLNIELNMLKSKIEGGFSFESVTILNNKFYFVLEKNANGRAYGMLAKAELQQGENNETILGFVATKEYARETGIHNTHDETILPYDGKILTIFEANGKNFENDRTAYVFNTDLELVNKIKFPQVEYRITDATNINNNNEFWCMNYFYPGDEDLLKPEIDSLSVKYGIGKSHANTMVVERIVKFEIDDGKIKHAGKKPVYIELEKGKSGRNWEGIVKFNNGFIIATDKFPGSILAYVPKN